MSIVLRLDLPSVLHILETSGPEVRLQLTEAIIAGAARRFALKAAPQQIENAVQREIWETIQGLAGHKPANNQRVEEFKNRVSNLAKGALETIIAERVAAAIEQIEGKLDRLVDGRIAIEVHDRIAAGVKARIDGVMAAVASQ